MTALNICKCGHGELQHEVSPTLGAWCYATIWLRLSMTADGREIPSDPRYCPCEEYEFGRTVAA